MSFPTVFAQITALAHREAFERCVFRYNADAYIKHFSCRQQWLAMCFAQLTYRQSLRDLEVCLAARPHLLYQMGFRGPVPRSTLADANEQRDWRVFADYAQTLVARARRLYAGTPSTLALEQTVYALDATVIDLCLSLFPWAQSLPTKSAIRLNTLLDLQGAIPTFVSISAGKGHEVSVLKELIPEPGAIYVMDRGYLHWAPLAHFAAQGAYFVTRAKTNLGYRVETSLPNAPAQGVLLDQYVRLRGPLAQKVYPHRLRRIQYHDAAEEKLLVFLTNELLLPATKIAQLYRARWQIELFFRWIKQHLHIHRFMGNTDNAVRTQVWSAISTYLLVVILKRTYALNLSLHQILQILSVTPFEQVPIPELFAKIESGQETLELANLF